MNSFRAVYLVLVVMDENQVNMQVHEERIVVKHQACVIGKTCGVCKTGKKHRALLWAKSRVLPSHHIICTSQAGATPKV